MHCAIEFELVRNKQTNIHCIAQFGVRCHAETGSLSIYLIKLGIVHYVSTMEPKEKPALYLLIFLC